MSIEQNKQLAREFFERFSANDVAGALDTMVAQTAITKISTS